MTPTGSEQTQKTPENQQIREPRGTDSGTRVAQCSDESKSPDIELSQIAALWSHLPAAARSAMLALAKAAAQGTTTNSCPSNGDLQQRR